MLKFFTQCNNSRDLAGPRDPWQTGKHALVDFASYLPVRLYNAKHVCQPWPRTWQTGKLLGLGEFDAYHIAAAEAGSCDRLATCDDRFLKAARRNAGKIKVRVMNPVQLVSEADF